MKRLLTILLVFSSGLVYSHPGIGMVYDGNEWIYYTDLNHVWKINIHTGQKEIAVENVHTHELCLDKDGNLYGEHYWYVESVSEFRNYIWRLGPDGDFEKIRGNQKGENLDFSFVRDSVFTGYYIREVEGIHHFIQTSSDSETILYSQRLNKPTWKYLKDGNELLFVDYPSIYSFKDREVKLFAGNISSSSFPFSIQSDDHSIYGIWQDRESNIYVAVYSGREVKKIDPKGNVSRVLKTGYFWSPVNGLFDKDDNLWIMESTLNGRIRVRKIEGK